MVAECLGHLALLDGPGVLPALQAASGTASGNVRTVVATAVKHMVVEAPHPIDALLKDSMPGFLAHISDADRCGLGPAVLKRTKNTQNPANGNLQTYNMAEAGLFKPNSGQSAL